MRDPSKLIMHKMAVYSNVLSTLMKKRILSNVDSALDIHYYIGAGLIKWISRSLRSPRSQTTFATSITSTLPQLWNKQYRVFSTFPRVKEPPRKIQNPVVDLHQLHHQPNLNQSKLKAPMAKWMKGKDSWRGNHRYISWSEQLLPSEQESVQRQTHRQCGQHM